VVRRSERMTNIRAAYDKIHPEEERHYYTWLEDYLERLEGKEAYREFQAHHGGTPGYYALVASLAA
jgi:uncharacterized NAD(P)/FAD-binding protein YdhS